MQGNTLVAGLVWLSTLDYRLSTMMSSLAHSPYSWKWKMTTLLRYSSNKQAGTEGGKLFTINTHILHVHERFIRSWELLYCTRHTHLTVLLLHSFCFLMCMSGLLPLLESDDEMMYMYQGCIIYARINSYSDQKMQLHLAHAITSLVPRLSRALQQSAWTPGDEATRSPGCCLCD